MRTGGIGIGIGISVGIRIGVMVMVGVVMTGIVRFHSHSRHLGVSRG